MSALQKHNSSPIRLVSGGRASAYFLATCSLAGHVGVVHGKFLSASSTSSQHAGAGAGASASSYLPVQLYSWNPKDLKWSRTREIRTPCSSASSPVLDDSSGVDSAPMKISVEDVKRHVIATISSSPQTDEVPTFIGWRRVSLTRVKPIAEGGKLVGYDSMELTDAEISPDGMVRSNKRTMIECLPYMKVFARVHRSVVMEKVVHRGGTSFVPEFFWSQSATNTIRGITWWGAGGIQDFLEYVAPHEKVPMPKTLNVWQAFANYVPLKRFLQPEEAAHKAVCVAEDKTNTWLDTFSPQQRTPPPGRGKPYIEEQEQAIDMRLRRRGAGQGKNKDIRVEDEKAEFTKALEATGFSPTANPDLGPFFGQRDNPAAPLSKFDQHTNLFYYDLTRLPKVTELLLSFYDLPLQDAAASSFFYAGAQLLRVINKVAERTHHALGQFVPVDAGNPSNVPWPDPFSSAFRHGDLGMKAQSRAVRQLQSSAAPLIAAIYGELEELEEWNRQSLQYLNEYKHALAESRSSLEWTKRQDWAGVWSVSDEYRRNLRELEHVERKFDREKQQQAKKYKNQKAAGERRLKDAAVYENAVSQSVQTTPAHTGTPHGRYAREEELAREAREDLAAKAAGGLEGLRSPRPSSPAARSRQLNDDPPMTPQGRAPGSTSSRRFPQEITPSTRARRQKRSDEHEATIPPWQKSYRSMWVSMVFAPAWRHCRVLGALYRTGVVLLNEYYSRRDRLLRPHGHPPQAPAFAEKLQAAVGKGQAVALLAGAPRSGDALVRLHALQTCKNVFGENFERIQKTDLSRKRTSPLPYRRALVQLQMDSPALMMDDSGDELVRNMPIKLEDAIPGTKDEETEELKTKDIDALFVSP